MLERLKNGELPICGQKAIRQPEAVVTEAPYSNCTECPLPHTHNGTGVVTVRLEHGGKVYGILCCSVPNAVTCDKDELALFEEVAGDIAFALHSLELEEQRKQLEKNLVEEKKRLEVTLHSTGDGVIATDIEGNVTVLNRVAEQLTGWTQEEAIGKPLNEVFHVINENTRKRIPNPVATVLETGRIVGLINHAVLISRDGTERIIADSGAPIHDELGNLFGVILVFRDITETRRLEEELHRLDKLESIGTLAGGIAHDFNNLLTGIIGYISLARRHVEPQSKADKGLIEAEKASWRARDLTQQLLTFASGGLPIKKTVSITELIKESATFALRGSNVKGEYSLPDDLWRVEIDEGQINQVMTNLVINAVEAMPGGGYST